MDLVDIAPNPIGILGRPSAAIDEMPPHDSRAPQLEIAEVALGRHSDRVKIPLEIEVPCFRREIRCFDTDLEFSQSAARGTELEAPVFRR
jgi:hypothetical protein